MIRNISCRIIGNIKGLFFLIDFIIIFELRKMLRIKVRVFFDSNVEGYFYEVESKWK